MSDMSDFEVMQKMADQGKDIAVSTSLLEVIDGKKVAKAVMQIDSPAAQKLMRTHVFGGNENYVAILYVVNMNDFNEVKYPKKKSEDNG